MGYAIVQKHVIMKFITNRCRLLDLATKTEPLCSKLKMCGDGTRRGAEVQSVVLKAKAVVENRLIVDFVRETIAGFGILF